MKSYFEILQELAEENGVNLRQVYAKSKPRISDSTYYRHKLGQCDMNHADAMRFKRSILREAKRAEQEQD